MKRNRTNLPLPVSVSQYLTKGDQSEILIPEGSILSLNPFNHI